MLHTPTSSSTGGGVVTARARSASAATAAASAGRGPPAHRRAERDDRAERHEPAADPEPERHRVHRDADGDAALLVRRRDDREVDVLEDARCGPTACRSPGCCSGTSRPRARTSRGRGRPCSSARSAETVVFWPVRRRARVRRTSPCSPPTVDRLAPAEPHLALGAERAGGRERDRDADHADVHDEPAVAARVAAHRAGERARASRCWSARRRARTATPGLADDRRRSRTSASPNASTVASVRVEEDDA